MALIFLGVLIVFFTRQTTVTSSPIHPTSVHWIIRFGGNAGVLLLAATGAKTVPKFTDALLPCVVNFVAN